MSSSAAACASCAVTASASGRESLAASGRTISFEGGESADYDGVVWATGFRIDHSWMDIPEVKDERGQVRHVRGVTDSPGLYLLGMTWQYTRTSALLGWVGD